MIVRWSCLFLLAASGCASVGVGRGGPSAGPIPEIPEWIHERSFCARDGETLLIYGVARLHQSGVWRNGGLARTTALNRARQPIMELLGMGETHLSDTSSARVTTVRSGGGEWVSERKSRASIRFSAYSGAVGPMRIAAAWYDSENEDLYILAEATPFDQSLELPPQPVIDIRSNQVQHEAFALFLGDGRSTSASTAVARSDAGPAAPAAPAASAAPRPIPDPLPCRSHGVPVDRPPPDPLGQRTVGRDPPSPQTDDHSRRRRKTAVRLQVMDGEIVMAE